MTVEFLEDQNLDSERLSLADALKKVLESHAQELRVSMPAIVEKYNYQTQTVDVRPVFQRQNLDGQVADMPIIRNVPVAFPRAGDSFIAFPIKKGHYVLLVFADRSLDKFLTNGGKSSPDDSRAHDITDAIAFAGCYPKNEALSLPNATDLIIKNKKESQTIEIRLKENGHMQILNQNGFDLVSLIDDLLTEVRAARVVTGDAGVQPLVNPRFSLLQAKIRTFKEEG